MRSPLRHASPLLLVCVPVLALASCATPSHVRKIVTSEYDGNGQLLSRTVVEEIYQADVPLHAMKPSEAPVRMTTIEDRRGDRGR